MQLFDMFKLSKELDLKDGEIKVMKTNVNIIPTSLFCELQKKLVNTWGFEKAYEQIYNSAKIGSQKYNDSFIQKHKFEDKRKILNWQIKIVTMSGWGKLEIAFVDLKTKQLIIKYDNSPFAARYGKSKYPVCIVPTGFTAGGVTANFGENIEAVETKCMAMGDPFCQIELGSKESIEEKKKQLWEKIRAKT
jgi:predicted hydrocarbon binding protein